VELVVCVGLIALLAAAIGLGMHRAQQRTAQARARLGQTQQVHDWVFFLDNELRWAEALTSLGPTSMTIRRQGVGGPGGSTVCYSWDAAQKTLLRSVDGGSPEIIARDIESFALTTDQASQHGATYVRGVHLTAQVGATDVVRRYIPTVNTPEVAGI
jgi:hypothetical protein